MRKIYFIFIFLLSFSFVYAEEKTEGFEDVSITDVSNYVGTKFSNAWVVIGGQVSTYSGYTQYDISSTPKNVRSGSKSLVADYGSSNSAFVAIPTELSGEFKFWAKSTLSSSSRYSSAVKIYRLEKDGDSYKTVSTIQTFNPTKGGTWKDYTIDLGDEPVLIGINLIRTGVDDIIYNTYEAKDGPQMAVYDGDNRVKNGAQFDAGLVEELPSQTFSLRNAGNATLNATITGSGDFSVTPANVTIDAGGETSFTVTCSSAQAGVKTGTVVLSAEGLDNISFDFTGIIRDHNKLYYDFSTAPESWTLTHEETTWGSPEDWKFTDGYASSGYYTVHMTSPVISVDENEYIYLKFKKNSSSSYSSAILDIKYSEDGATWKELADLSAECEYNVWKSKTISDIPTTAKYIQIAGKYVDIDDLYGLSLPHTPVMTIAGPDAGNMLAFGSIKSGDVKKSVIVTNSGIGTLNAEITVSNDNFSVSKASVSLAEGESQTIEVAVVFDNIYGEKKADIIFHPTNEGLSDVVVHVTALTKDPNIWEEDFEEGTMPIGWDTTGAVVENKNGSMMAFLGGYNTSYILTTPRLKAKANEVLTYDAFVRGKIIVEYSTDEGNSWQEYESFETETFSGETRNMKFVAPAEGIYYLRFSGAYNYVDNFSGFMLTPKEHEVGIEHVTYPSEMWQYLDNEVVVHVKELVGKDESVKVTLYVDGKAVATKVVTLSAAANENITLIYNSTVPVEDVDAYVEIEYADVKAMSEKATIAVKAAPILDENAENNIESGEYPVLVLKYQAQKGWNTFAFPFQITDLSIFGEGAKAYELRSYDNGSLTFDVTRTYYAGYPFVLYVETPSVESQHLLYNVNVTAPTEKADSYGSVIFQSTYSPIAAPGMQGLFGVVPSTGRIQIGGSNASLKGLRAYFVTEGLGAKELNSLFTDETVTGVSRINNYNQLQSSEQLYNLTGQRVGKGYKGVIINNGKKYIKK
jgi:hypothetical protein